MAHDAGDNDGFPPERLTGIIVPKRLVRRFPNRVEARAMNALQNQDDVEVVPLELPLDLRTIAWLARLTHVTGDRAADIVASMLRAIREDDEAAHEPQDDAALETQTHH